MANSFQTFTTHKTGDKLTYKIDPLVGDYLTQYFSLRVGKAKLKAPYFINTKKRKDLRVLMGKGTPDEMVLETKVWAQVKGLDVNNMSPEEIRKLMTEVGIGIDCSGFIYHGLNSLIRANGGKELIKYFAFEKYSLRLWLARLLRPIENLGANDMTSKLNCKKIKLKDIRPGDLIRGIGKQRNAYHVALVNKVEAEIINGEIVPTSFTYLHSHRAYGKKNGVRLGKVLVVDAKKDLLKQNWLEVHTDGVNYIFENDLKPYPEDSGLRRLRFLE